MKVLIFTNSSYKFNNSTNQYHGAGWIDSLLMLLESNQTIQLGLSFFHNEKSGKLVKGNITYYPNFQESRKKRPFRTFLKDWTGKIESDKTYKPLLNVVEDFQPDIIQVFGTEGVFSCIQKYTKVPVLVHLQGLLNPYYNTYYPINQSKWNFLISRIYLKANILGKGPSFAAKRFKNMAIRETENLKHIKFVCGRTDWDSIVTRIHNPSIKYFHIDEILRPIFYADDIKFLKKSKNDVLQIVTTISPTIYKGIDVILKTAKLLTKQTNIQFVWKIIGVNAQHTFVRHFEKSLKIRHDEVNVEFVGIQKSEKFINLLKNSHLYIHPSYIDNSPNSVCEAQIVGLPVIACNVGGLSSLIKDGDTGILVPSNGIYEIANVIINFTKKPELYNKIGSNARQLAIKRHDRNKIVEELIRTYHKISFKNFNN